jgi:hypothetical protein
MVVSSSITVSLVVLIGPFNDCLPTPIRSAEAKVVTYRPFTSAAPDPAPAA